MKDQLLEEINNNIEGKIEKSAIESCLDIKARNDEFIKLMEKENE